jgi:putative oxidoreductase
MTSAVDIGLLILRCAVAAVCLAHGVNHIFGGGKIAGTGRWFDSLGMKPGIVHAWVASLTEISSGLLLGLGFLTELGAAGLLGTMVVAWVTNHARNGFFIFRPGEGYEYVMILSACAVGLAGTGPGRWSITSSACSIRPPGGGSPPPAESAPVAPRRCLCSAGDPVLVLRWLERHDVTERYVRTAACASSVNTTSSSASTPALTGTCRLRLSRTFA